MTPTIENRADTGNKSEVIVVCWPKMGFWNKGVVSYAIGLHILKGVGFRYENSAIHSNYIASIFLKVRTTI